MSTVDNRVVSLTFDNDQFVAAMEATIKTIESLDDNIKKLVNNSDSFSNLESEVKSFKSEVASSSSNVEDSISGIQTAIEKLTDSFSGLSLVGKTVLSTLASTATNAITGLIGNTIGQIMTGGLTRALNLEQAEFLLEGLGADVDTVMDNVNTAVTDTAYSLDEAAKVAAVFTAAGISSGDKMVKSLTAVAGVAASTGAEFSEIGDIFSDVAARNRVYASDLTRLSSRGIAATTYLSKYLGVTTDDLTEMVKKGKVNFEDFSNAMYATFGEHAKDANKTFTGSLANMKAALSRIGALFYTPGLTYARDIFNSITPAINTLKTALVPVADSVMYVVEKLSGTFVEKMGEMVDSGKLAELLTERLQKLADKIVEVFDNIPSMIEKFKASGFGQLLDQTIQSVIYVGQSFEPVLQDLGGSISSFITNFGNYADNLMNILSLHIRPIIVNITDTFGHLYSVIKNLASKISYAISPLTDAFGNFFKKVFSKILEWIEKGSGKLEEYSGKFADFANEWLDSTDLFEKIHDKMEEFVDFVKEWIDKIKEWFEDSELIQTIKEWFENYKETVTNAIQSVIDSFNNQGGVNLGESSLNPIVNWIQEAYNFVKDKLNPYIESFKELLDNGTIIRMIDFAAYLAIIYAIYRFLKTYTELGESITDLVDRVGGDVGNSLIDWKRLTRTLNLFALVLFIKEIAAVINAIGDLDDVNIGSLAIIGIVFAALITAFTFISSRNFKNISFIKNLASFIAMLLLLKVFFKLFSSIGDNVNVDGLFTSAALLSIFMVAILSLDSLLTYLGNTKLSNITAASWNIVKITVFITLTLALLHVLQYMNRGIHVDDLAESMIIFAGLVSFLSVLDVFLQMLEIEGMSSILKATTTVTKIVALLSITMLMLRVLSNLSNIVSLSDLSKSISIFLTLIGVITALEVLFTYLEITDFSSVTAVTGTIVKISACFILISVLLNIISKMSSNLNLVEYTQTIFQLVALFTLMLLVSSVLGQASKNLGASSKNAMNILTFILALVSIIIAVKMLEYMDVGELARATLIIGSLFGFIIAANLLSKALDKITGMKDSGKGVKNLTSLLVMIAIITGALIWLSYLDLSSCLGAATSLGIVLAALSLVINVMSRASFSNVDEFKFGTAARILSILVVAALLACILPIIMDTFGISWDQSLSAATSLFICVSTIIALATAMSTIMSAAAIGQFNPVTLGKIAGVLVAGAILSVILPYLMKSLDISWGDCINACAMLISSIIAVSAAIAAVSAISHISTGAKIAPSTIIEALVILVGAAILTAGVAYISNMIDLDLGTVEKWILCIGEIEGLILVAAAIMVLINSHFGGVTVDYAPFIAAGLVIAASAALVTVVANFMPDNLNISGLEAMVDAITRITEIVGILGGVIEGLSLAASAVLSKFGLSPSAVAGGFAVTGAALLESTAIVALIIVLMALASKLSETYDITIDVGFFQDAADAFDALVPMIEDLAIAVGIISGIVALGGGGALIGGIAITTLFEALVFTAVALFGFASELSNYYGITIDVSLFQDSAIAFDALTPMLEALAGSVLVISGIVALGGGGALIGGIVITTLFEALVFTAVALFGFASELSNYYGITIDVSLFQDSAIAFDALIPMLEALAGAVVVISGIVALGGGGVLIAGIAITTLCAGLVALIVTIAAFASEVWDEYQRNKDSLDNLNKMTIAEDFTNFLIDMSDKFTDESLGKAERVYSMMDSWMSHLESDSFTSFVTWLSNITGTLSGLIGDDGNIAKLGEACTSLASFLDNDLFKKDVSDVQNASTIIQALTDTVDTNFADAISTLAGVEDPGSTISTTMKNLGAGITAFAKEITGKSSIFGNINWQDISISSAISALADMSQIIGDVIWDNFDSVPEGLNSDTFKSLAESVVSFMQTVYSGFNDVDEDTDVTTDLSSLSSSISVVSDLFDILGSTNFKNAVKTLSQSNDTIGIRGNTVKSTMTKFKDGMKALGEGLKELSEVEIDDDQISKLSSLFESISTFMNDISGLFTGVQTSLTGNKTTDTVTSTSFEFEAAMTSFKNGITTIIEAVKDIFVEADEDGNVLVKEFKAVDNFVEKLKPVLEKLGQITIDQTTMSNISSIADQNIDWSSLFTSLNNACKSLSGFTTATISDGQVQAVKSTISALNDIGEIVDVAFGNDGFMSSFDKFSAQDIFDNLDFAAVNDPVAAAAIENGSWDSGSTTFDEIITGITEFIDGVDKIFDAITNADLEVPDSTVISSIGTVMKMLNTVGSYLEYGEGYLDNLSVFDTSNLKTTDVDLGTALQAFISTVVGIFGSLTGIEELPDDSVLASLATLMENLNAIGEYFGDGDNAFMNNFSAFDESLIGDDEDGLAESIGNFITLVTSIFNELSGVEIPDLAIFDAMKTCMEKINEIGEYFGEDGYISNILTGEFNFDNITQLVDAFNLLSTITVEQSGNLSALATGLHDLTTALSELSDFDVSSIVDTFTVLSSTLVLDFVSNFETEVSNCIPRFTASIESVVDAISTAFTDRMPSTISTMITLVTDGLNQVADQIGFMWNTFYSASFSLGDAIVQGIANGINNSSFRGQVIEAARSLAQSAVTAVQNELDINSPSKVFMEIGRAIPEGFAMGIADQHLSKDIISATEEVANTAIRAANDIFNSEDDFSKFTISLVVDSSSAEDDLSVIRDIFDHGSMDLFNNASIDFGKYKEYNDSKNITSDQGGNVINNYDFTQNNTSPKALNRTELYRQTKNQFTRFRNRMTV